MRRLKIPGFQVIWWGCPLPPWPWVAFIPFSPSFHFIIPWSLHIGPLEVRRWKGPQP